MNIDDLLCLHSVEPEFIEHIKIHLNKNNLSESDLINKINYNDDICNYEGYSDFIENEWLLKDNDIDKAFIKFNISNEYMHNLLNGNIKYINCVIAEGILYNLYLLIDIGDKARIQAIDNLKRFNIIRYRNCRIISIDAKTNDYHELDNYFGGLEPQVSTSLRNITTQLRIITTLSKDVGAKRINIIDKNCEDDLGFYFAFISPDLSEIMKKSNTTKRNFLADLKQLITKYSEPEKESLDLYLDE